MIDWYRDLDNRILVKTVIFSTLLLILFYNQHSGLQARQRETRAALEYTCSSVNQQRSALVAYINQQLDRAEKSIPTLNYYQHHPVELGRALANISRQRRETQRAVAPLDCS